jgi:hypothetical protein
MDKKIFAKNKLKIILAISIIVIILVGVWLINRKNNYLIENHYYGFKLTTPRDWIVQEKSPVLKDNFENLLSQCGTGAVSSAEIATYRLGNKNYLKNLGGPLTGNMLNISVNCLSDAIKKQLADYGNSNFKVGGESALIYSSDSNRTKFISFLHGGLQYKISEYITISDKDKNEEKKMSDRAQKTFDKIISSIKFIK